MAKQDPYTKAIFIQNMFENRNKDKERIAKKKAAEETARAKAEATAKHHKELESIKRDTLKEKQRHDALMRQDACNARQEEKEHKQWLLELKQQIFEFRSQTKRASDLPDTIDRHDTLFKTQIDTKSIDISDLETIEDKEYHGKTLSMIEEGLLKTVKELGVDRTGIMSVLYTACVDSNTAYGNIKAFEAYIAIATVTSKLSEEVDAFKHKATLVNVDRDELHSIEEELNRFETMKRECVSRVTAISAISKEELMAMSANAISQTYEGWISSLREALQVVEDRLLDAKLDTPPDFGRGIDWADCHACLQDHTFMIRKFQLLLCFANAKGKLSREERDILNDQAGEWLISSKTVDHLIEKEAPLDEIAYTMDSESAAALFDSLFRVAAAKCDLLPIEETLIERIADSIGLDVPTRTMLVTKGKETFFDPIFEFQCLVALAKIDGTVDPEELKMLQQYAVACSIPSDKSTYMLKNTASSLNPAIFSGSEASATLIISALYSMAVVDNEFSTKEAHCIGKIGKAMGLSADTTKGILKNTKNTIEAQKRDALEAQKRDALAKAKATARKRAAQRKEQKALKVKRFLIVLGILGIIGLLSTPFILMKQGDLQWKQEKEQEQRQWEARKREQDALQREQANRQREQRREQEARQREAARQREQREQEARQREQEAHKREQEARRQYAEDMFLTTRFEPDVVVGKSALPFVTKVEIKGPGHSEVKELYQKKHWLKLINKIYKPQLVEYPDKSTIRRASSQLKSQDLFMVIQGKRLSEVYRMEQSGRLLYVIGFRSGNDRLGISRRNLGYIPGVQKTTSSLGLAVTYQISSDFGQKRVLFVSESNPRSIVKLFEKQYDKKARRLSAMLRVGDIDRKTYESRKAQLGADIRKKALGYFTNVVQPSK